jgi:predicted HicB family RNase H-like nuclease
MHMAAKLTLRINENVIRDAKRAARARGVSLPEKNYVLVALKAHA